MSTVPPLVLEISSSAPLGGPEDLAPSDPGARIPAHHRLKGLFFTRCVKAIGERWPVVVASLEEPPQDGVYAAFESYPSRDYQRLFLAAARIVHPKVSAREAVRLFARDEVAAFVSTMFGQVTFSMLSDPTVALLRYPEVFELLANGPKATATKLAERTVRIEITNAHAPLEYTLGVLEGIVLAYKRHCRLHVVSDEVGLQVEVRWMV